jgi:putative endonuclease
MPKVFTSERQKIGELGESLAVKFLMKQGFEIIERNYTRKMGEIDIVAKKNGKLRFIEVKAVQMTLVPRETAQKIRYTGNFFRPEENMHPVKLKKMYRTMEVYISEKGIFDLDWQIDLVTVYIDMGVRKARVEILENII